MAYDAVIIGGGPAGLTAALYLGRFGVSVALVEKMSAGGMMLQTADIENYPGFPAGAKGYELADAFEAQIAPYDITRLSGEVTAIEAPASGLRRVKIDEDWVETKTVIITAGVSYSKLGLPGEDKLLGRGLSYCALCDGQFFRNKPVAVVGGGNSALEESLYLAKLASHVHIIHRRTEFRGAPIYIDRVKNTPNITLETPYTISELQGEKFLTGLTLKHAASGEEKTLAVDGLFVFVGFLPASGFFPENLGVDAKGFILTDNEMRTNIPGVFAAGDIRSKLCRQVVTAVGDGATAANSAHTYLEQQHA